MTTTAAPAVPDLAATLPPEPPVPTSYDEWSLGSMGTYLAGLDSHQAWSYAKQAALHQAQDAGHLAVILALAAAESAAPDTSRPFHAARLDAYVAAYGLRGWYRYTDRNGRPRVQVNKIRTPEDGDRGRYYVHTAILRKQLPVVDRDTGQAVFTGTRAEADAWIAQAEKG